MYRRSRTIAVVVALGLGLGAMLLIPGESATSIGEAEAAPATIAAADPQDKLAALLGEPVAPVRTPAQLTVTPAAPAEPPQLAALPAAPIEAAAPDLTGLTPDRVGGAALNLRAGPSSATAQIAVLSPGQPVHVGTASGGWVEVTLDDGRTGWVFARYLESAAPVATAAATAPVEAAPARAVVQAAPGQRLEGRTARIAASLPVRARPAAAAQRLLTLTPGERVRILDVRGNWLRIETTAGISGWIERAG